jgi:hypothetical protein
MKQRRYLVAFLAFILLSISARAQQSNITRSISFTAAGSSSSVDLSGTSITRHKIQWWGTGTRTTCTVKVEQSEDASTWSDLFSAQTCTTDGVYRTTADSSPHFIRITLATLSGGGSIKIRYDGYVPVVTAGGGGLGPVILTGTPNSGDVPSATSATTATWQATPSIPNGNAIYVSPNCGSQTNCFPVIGGVQYVNDASWTSAGTTITTGSSDPPFVCPGSSFPCTSGGDVGSIEFGTSNCGADNGYVDCHLQIPQGTITTVTDAHHAVVSLAATATSGPIVGWFTWGKADDAPAMQTAFAKVVNLASVSLTNGGNTLNLPCTSTFIGSTPFSVTQAHMNPISIEGCPSAYLIPLPSFDYADCPAGATYTWGCIYSDSFTGETRLGGYEQTPAFWDVIENLNIWGAGQDGTSLPGTTHISSFSGNQLFLENVNVTGWNSNFYPSSFSTSCTYAVASSFLVNSMSWSSGGCGIFIAGVSIEQSPTQITGGLYCCGMGYGSGGGLIIPSGSTAEVASNGVTFGCGACGAGTYTLFGVYQQGGVWKSDGDLIGAATIAGGTAYISKMRDGYLSAYQLRISSGKVYLRDSRINSLSLVSTGSLYDECGNTFASVADATGSVFGSCSINGTLLATGNLVLSGNWGTTAATSAWKGATSPVSFTITNGTAATGASPTVAYTFPVAYLAAPLWCSATQVGGTNPMGTFTSSALSATGVTFTFSLSPTANDTEFVQVECKTQ